MAIRCRRCAGRPKSTYQAGRRPLCQGLRDQSQKTRGLNLLHRDRLLSLQANAKHRRAGSTRPRRPVPIHQHTAGRLPRRRTASDQRRHQEEGAGRRFQERRQEWQPGEPSRTSSRLHDPEQRQGHPLGVYDLGSDQGWVTVGDDHDTARFAVQPSGWWAQMGQSRFPGATTLLDLRRRRRFQRLSGPGLEGRTGQLGGRHRTGDHRLPLSAGHVEVEQDRAPHVQLHHHELARPTPHLLPGRRAVGTANTTTNKGLKIGSGTRRVLVPDRREDHQQRACCRPAHPPRVPRGLELHLCTRYRSTKVSPRALRVTNG